MPSSAKGRPPGVPLADALMVRGERGLPLTLLRRAWTR